MSDRREVTFNDCVQVIRMHTWSFAYRVARVGVWEREYLDCLRFKERIHRIGCIIIPILSEEHRVSVFIRFHEP